MLLNLLALSNVCRCCAGVSRLAGALADLGVGRGDRVLIYMPLIPEAIIAMLATARLGAIHSVVFGGFAARELCARIEHAEPKIIIAASCGVEPNKVVRYKGILNEAIAASKVKPKNCIIFQRYNVDVAELEDGFDILWEDAIQSSLPHPCVPVEANEPLYILYTSGTTDHPWIGRDYSTPQPYPNPNSRHCLYLDQPKGILRPVGGHIATLAWTMRTIYGMNKDDVWWTASDMGWVVGHSYICYGPLCYGITSVMYEGKPDRTPDPGQYFRLIHEHKVNGLLTAPTALRVIKREDPEITKGRKYSTKTGQMAQGITLLLDWPADDREVGARIPVRILRSNGSEADIGELGRIVVKLPLPPGTMSSLYKAPERFLQVYFSKFPGYYDTMDAGYRDDFGYIYVTARDDDVINVAGHRLSTAALEDVVMSHPDIGDAAVIGVPETTKGEIPLCLFIMKKGARKSEKAISHELVLMVRELIGPIAAFRLSAAVSGLPRTRSGKIARKSIADLARSKSVKIPSTIEDPSVYKNIKEVLQSFGFAKNAPDPK
uniref:Acyl-CoA synthetase short-chain family member 3, mitochondrial n=1 Tax=Timema shepardi TaxID=629360 RepID=A0A7R9FVQ1_TIMSH|nr:unnamed protein product [Timema shepardi]